MRSVNENTLPENIAQRLAELTAEIAELSRRVRMVEDHRGRESAAQPIDLTVDSYDDDEISIHFLTENGFVIVRPWEARKAVALAERGLRFRVQDPDGIEREISMVISNRLLRETELRTRGRIDAASQFWISCAERRLANRLMEHGEFPAAGEIVIETLEREDVLLSLRWGKYE